MKLRVLILLALLAAAVVLTACVRKPAATETETKTEKAEPVTYSASAQKQLADDSLEFIKANVLDTASIAQITDAFEQLCAEPSADEMVLFEAGTFKSNGDRLFTVSLVRQIPDGEDEFFQIRADLSFEPDEDNRKIKEKIWLDPANGYDFSAVRESDAFAYAEAHSAYRFEICIDEP